MVSKNRKITVALVGNPNCGKTTLFNRLTGTHQKVGNWTGVTVEKKEGVYKKDKNVAITDLPGVYSLSAVSEDEKAVIRYLTETPPDVIINVIDGTNLERNLYLTDTLKKTGVPMIAAVNFADDLKKRGIVPDYKKLSEKLNVLTIGISALKGENVDKVVSLAVAAATDIANGNYAARNDTGGNYAARTDAAVHNVTARTDAAVRNANARTDSAVRNANARTDAVAHNAAEVKGFDEKSDAQKRIAQIVSECVTYPAVKTRSFTDRIDKIVLNKYLCYPIFIVVMTAFFALSVKLGGLLGKYTEALFSVSESGAEKLLNSFSAPDFIVSFILCIISGLKSVFAFLPHILIMFLCLSVLEQSGYMSRVAFICDKPFGDAGLGGKSVIPLILSSGCTVTGLMATRTIEDESERERTMLSLLFVPCGAKAAVISYFTQEFFGGNVLIAVSLYFLSLFTAIGVAKCFKKRKKSDNGFVLEMPPYRVPSVKDVLYVLYEKIKDFTFKAGTVILSVSVILWALKSFGVHGYTENVSESFLYYIGNGLKYLLYPIGIKSWECAVSALAGMLAREAVIETLPTLSADIYSFFPSPFSVYAFVVFILFLPPCAASLSALKGELKNNKKTVKIIGLEISTAYAFAIVINLLQFAENCVFSLISALCVVIIIMLSVKSLLKSSCTGCKCGVEDCNKHCANGCNGYCADQAFQK